MRICAGLQLGEVLALEHARCPPVGSVQPEQRAAGGRLAAARLPHQPEGLAGAEVEADVADRLHRADRAADHAGAAHRELLDQVAHRQDRLDGSCRASAFERPLEVRGLRRDVAARQVGLDRRHLAVRRRSSGHGPPRPSSERIVAGAHALVAGIAGRAGAHERLASTRGVEEVGGVDVALELGPAVAGRQVVGAAGHLERRLGLEADVRDEGAAGRNGQPGGRLTQRRRRALDRREQLVLGVETRQRRRAARACTACAGL